jgi:hypothetical protein
LPLLRIRVAAFLLEEKVDARTVYKLVRKINDCYYSYAAKSPLWQIRYSIGRRTYPITNSFIYVFDTKANLYRFYIAESIDLDPDPTKFATLEGEAEIATEFTNPVRSVHGFKELFWLKVNKNPQITATSSDDVYTAPLGTLYAKWFKPTRELTVEELL